MADIRYEAHQAQGAQLAEDLARESPAAAALLREHREDNAGVLPTLFLGDLARWFLEACRNRDEDRPRYEEAHAVVTLLGRRFANGEEPLRNMIAVGFVEMFPYPGEPERGCVDLLPEPLREERARMESWSPEK